jgi:hypothetical protein
MNYSLFRTMYDPESYAVKKANEALFKDCKLIENSQCRKRLSALTWDLTG